VGPKFLLKAQGVYYKADPYWKISSCFHFSLWSCEVSYLSEIIRLHYFFYISISVNIHSIFWIYFMMKVNIAWADQYFFYNFTEQMTAHMYTHISVPSGTGNGVLCCSFTLTLQKPQRAF